MANSINRIINLAQNNVLSLFKAKKNNRIFKDLSFKYLVSITETSTDSVTMTQHPVEKGANITDHAFVNPKQVDIQFAYSPQTGLSLNDVYDKLIKLMEDRIPFDITTGKRKYKNMLIESIRNQTDCKSENILVVDVTAKEIIIVETSTKSDNKNSKDAKNTSEKNDRGNIQLKT